MTMAKKNHNFWIIVICFITGIVLGSAIIYYSYSCPSSREVLDEGFMGCSIGCTHRKIEQHCNENFCYWSSEIPINDSEKDCIIKCLGGWK